MEVTKKYDQQFEKALKYWTDADNVCEAKSLKEAISNRLKCKKDAYFAEEVPDCEGGFRSDWIRDKKENNCNL